MEGNRGFKRVFLEVFLLKVAMKFMCWKRAEILSEALLRGKPKSIFNPTLKKSRFL